MRGIYVCSAAENDFTESLSWYANKDTEPRQTLSAVPSTFTESWGRGCWNPHMQDPPPRSVAAHFSWIAPVIATLCFASSTQVPISVHRLATLLVAGGFLLIPFGLGCVFFVLASNRSYAYRSVLIPAVAGFVLNFSLMLLLTQVKLPNYPD